MVEIEWTELKFEDEEHKVMYLFHKSDSNRKMNEIIWILALCKKIKLCRNFGENYKGVW